MAKILMTINLPGAYYFYCSVYIELIEMKRYNHLGSPCPSYECWIANVFIIDD